MRYLCWYKLTITKLPRGWNYLTTIALMEKLNHCELRTCQIPIAIRYQSQKVTQVTELGFKPRYLDSKLTFLTTSQTSNLSSIAKQPLLVLL